MPDATKQALSGVSLRWMVHEVMKSQCGIQFDAAALKRLAIPCDVVAPGSDGPAEDALDARDCVMPLHDALSSMPVWWILEVIPMNYTWQDAKGVWRTKFRCAAAVSACLPLLAGLDCSDPSCFAFSTRSAHLGRGRQIPDTAPKFHYTVKERMEDAAFKYKPKAKWTVGTETYVT